MPELQHPAFADVTIEVPDDRVQDHLDAGWLKPTSAKAKRVREADEQ